MGALSNLEVLRLEKNRLTGGIPPELGQLGRLRILSLSSAPYARNTLTGEIPPALGRLANLEELDLFGNRLTGSIPPSLGALSNLVYLNLGENQLSGPTPPQLGLLTGLRSLDLAENALGGSIPPELGNLFRLTVLRLNHNDLTGAIPPSLGSLKRLRYMELNDNQLTGGIPREFGQLRNPEVLDLRNNGLTGEIPAELADAFDGPFGLLLAGNPWESCLPAALRPLVDRPLVVQPGSVTAAEDLPVGSDLKFLGLSYCQCLPRPQGGGPSPDLREGPDGIPFLTQEATSVPGTYRLTFSLVLDLPPGGVFRLENWRRGPYVNGGFAGGAVSVTISELITGSHLFIDPFTGYVYDRRGVDEPPDCDGAPSRLFDRIVTSMRNQPPYTSPTPENILHPAEARLEGGRTYWLNEALSLIFDVPKLPEGTAFGGSVPCTEWTEEGCDLTLRVGAAGSRLILIAATGQTWHWRQGDGGLDPVLNHVAASVRQHLPPPSCDRPETAPDCAILLQARDTLAGDAHLNWDAQLPLPYWEGVTVDRSTGRVVEIFVRGSTRDAQIPQELGQLTHLETLDLSFNQLTGSIPPELGELPNLQELNLRFNRLEGCIPMTLWQFDIASWQTSNLDLRRCEESE